VASQRRVDEKTPNGGAYSIAFFFNDRRESVDETEATGMEVVEYLADGTEIFRTYGTFGRRDG
jgi:hypothetical protein